MDMNTSRTLAMRTQLKNSTGNEQHERLATQLSARKIMGRNIFGVEEAIKYFEVDPSDAQLAVLSEIPYSEATLKECRDTHVLVAYFPISVFEMSRIVDRKIYYYQDQDADYRAIAMRRGEVGWYLIRRTIVPNTLGRTWNEQRALLAHNEEIPVSCTMTYTIAAHHGATGEKLFENVGIRCSDVTPSGRQVYISYFSNGFVPDEHVGLASSRVGYTRCSSASAGSLPATTGLPHYRQARLLGSQY